MVSKKDVQMYLLALKSFYARLKRGKVVAIIDHDMPESSRRILVRHIPGIRFVILEEIETGSCQRGGTWERVLYLTDHSQTEYAIQLDSDTFTSGPIESAIVCIEHGIPFTLGSSMQPLESMPEAAARARRSQSHHICMVSERLFDKYPRAAELKYVSGSSGFAGFSKGGFTRQGLEQFHANMAQLVGPRWSEWGTEQCASNFAIANTPGALVLQRPKYGNFNPRIETGEAEFLHYYGTHRYEGDHFARSALQLIRDLGAKVTANHK